MNEALFSCSRNGPPIEVFWLACYCSHCFPVGFVEIANSQKATDINFTTEASITNLKSGHCVLRPTVLGPESLKSLEAAKQAFTAAAILVSDPSRMTNSGAADRAAARLPWRGTFSP